MTPRKYAVEIKAWADGIEIQQRSFMTNHEWVDLEDGDEPCFMGSTEWRIKPAPPAKAYPVTGMSAQDLCVLWDSVPDGGTAVKMAHIANAALRHAIDASYMFTLNTINEVTAGAYDAGKKIGMARHAARDLAIAEAVRHACLSARYTIPGPDSVDLAVIVAGVK